MLSNPLTNVNITFYGNHPLFVTIGRKLENAGCAISYYMADTEKPRFGAHYYTHADENHFLNVSTTNLEGNLTELPKQPEEIITPTQAIQYSKAYLKAFGYMVSA